MNTFTGLWKGRYPYLFCIIINVKSIFDTAVGLIRIRHGDSDNRNWLSCVFSASLEAEGGGTEITPWIGECKPIASQLIRPLRVRRTPLPAPPYHPTWWNTEPRDEPSFLAFIRGILVSKFQRHFLRSFRTFNMSSFHKFFRHVFYINTSTISLIMRRCFFLFPFVLFNNIQECRRLSFNRHQGLHPKPWCNWRWKNTALYEWGIIMRIVVF